MEDISTIIADTLQKYYTDFIELLPSLILAFLVIITFSIISNKIKKVMYGYLKSKMDDPLLAQFISRMVKAIIILASWLLALKIVGLGSVSSSILATAGVGAFVVGFAFKDIGENLLAGILLAFGRPFRIGDTVELGNQKGTVIALNLRDTQIKSPDGKDIFIPNGNIIKNPVINYTIDGFLRQNFNVNLAYGSDINLAIHTIQEVLQHIDGILQQDGRKPAVSIADMDAGSLNVAVSYWLDTFNPLRSGSSIKTEAIDRIFKALVEAGFYLPGNTLEIKNYQHSE